MQCVIYSTYFVKPGTRYEFKTHLTNHCLGIRWWWGKFIPEVVKSQETNTNPHSHIQIFYK